MNVRQRRVAARHALHAAKFLEARLLNCNVACLEAKTRNNIHILQGMINAKRKS